jgi:type I restriction enzyme, S subunit
MNVALQSVAVCGKVRAEWEVAKFADVVFFQEGPGLRKWQWTNAGMKVINVTNILGDGQIDTANTRRFISLDEFNEKYRHFAVDDGDIVIASSGNTYGKIGRISAKDLPVMMNTSVIRLRSADKRRLDHDFLHAFLRSDLFRNQMESFVIGSAQPNFGPSHLKQMMMPLPPLPVQHRISDILSAYDELIENNQRRIKILEAMARSLYREWFILFRFPGHDKVKMVPSLLGPIPQGWEIGLLGDLVQFKSGSAFKSGTFSTDGEYRLVTIKNVQDGSFNPECDSRINEPPDNLPPHCILESGDILLSLTGNVGRTCLVYDSPFLLNQRVAKLVPTQSTDQALTYCMFRETAMRVKLEQLSTGVAQQNLSPVLASKMEVAIPTRELRERFSAVAEAMIKSMVQLYSTNSNLRRTRDLLLPRLLSGQVSVTC